MTARKSRRKSAAKPRARAAPVKLRSAASGRLIERVRGLCLALPEAAEKLSHGEPTWFAGAGKVFASIDDHHHGAPHLSVWLPMPPGVQEGLVRAQPERYFRPPYVGHRGWIGVVLDGRPDWRVVADLIQEAYRHVASPRLVARLDG
jgi:predicted DNA-binding protein (MmcQ/YjbR family)